MQLLNNINFEWKINHNLETWNKKYHDLVNYVKKFGHARVPAVFADNPSLGQWVSTQRLLHTKIQNENSPHGLTIEQIQLLNNIGFEWSIWTNDWKLRYDELISYETEFGNANVPPNFPQNPSLGRWVSKQRTEYKKFQNGNLSCGLTIEKIQNLNNIGFKWSICTTETWNARYDELISYATEFGNANLPQSFPQNPPLGYWVAKQRSKYKMFQKGNKVCGITTSQIQQLNNIGFEWSICTNEVWKTRYEELVSYATEFDNANVPHDLPQNPSLGNWVSRQRTKYKMFTNGNTLCGITTYEIQLLNIIGFGWKRSGKGSIFLGMVKTRT